MGGFIIHSSLKIIFSSKTQRRWTLSPFQTFGAEIFVLFSVTRASFHQMIPPSVDPFSVPIFWNGFFYLE
jgi:hypothetical protein